MATTLGSWDPMTEAHRATRRAITVVVAVLAVIAAAILGGIKLWPNDSSPSGEGAKEADLTWKAAADGVSLPVSRSAGPQRFVNGRGSDFARSELGAALAAIHISHNASAGPGPAIFTATIRSQVTGTERDAMLDHISGEYETDRQKFGLPEGAPLPGPAAARIAYKVNRYSEADAAITVASGLASDATKFFAFDLELRWMNGDWHMVAPPGGSFASVFKELPSLPPGSVVLEGHN